LAKEKREGFVEVLKKTRPRGVVELVVVGKSPEKEGEGKPENLAARGKGKPSARSNEILLRVKRKIRKERLRKKKSRKR